jgi:adenylate cyclase
MSLKKWLNDHNLAVSAVGVSLLVLLLYMTRLSFYGLLGFPYLKLEYAAQDWIYKLGKTAPLDPRVVFLYDDAASHNLDHLWDEEFEAQPILKRMKTRSWPRDVFAAILDRLHGAGARVVGFDYVFQGEFPELDPTLRAALDRSGEGVVVGSQLDDSRISKQIRRQFNPPAASLIPDLRDPRVGYINVFPDPDETVRRFQFRLTLEEIAGLPRPPDATEFVSLPVRMLMNAGEGAKVPAGTERHRLRFAYKGETVVDEQRPESVANIFVQSIWESNYKNGEFFRDKIVLVGPTGNLNKDLALSPFGTIGGPELHLNVVHALLSGSFLLESPFTVDIALILAGGLLALVACKIVRHPILRVALLLVLGSAYFGAALLAFDHRNLVIPVFSPLLSLIGSGSVSIVWQQIIERLEKAKLRHTFERYVSRDVVKELVDNPQSFLNSMVGVRKNVTVLFSDIRGFTTVTESGDATQLVAQLNEYFDHMVNLVFANRGTLDKFIGDAVMAQWGGITSRGEKDDAIDAVRTAIQMRERLVELNKTWISQGRLDLKVGIGINHGEAIVGNLGCEAKAEISLIGDAVNTASRFEGMTKQFHIDLIIGEKVAALVRDRFIVRTVALSQPKGKLKPVEIFTVLDERTNGKVNPAWLVSYEEGVKLYRTREFSKAADCFESAIKDIPSDWLCESYLTESREFAVNPPPPDWSPVDVMTSK